MTLNLLKLDCINNVITPCTNEFFLKEFRYKTSMMFVAAQTQRIVFRHKRFGRRSIPSSTDITEGTGCILKPPDEQNTDIQILSPVTMSPSDSRPSSSQEHYPDLASQMESFYQPPVHYDGSRRNSKVLSWINDGKDMLFEDTGAEHGASK